MKFLEFYNEILGCKNHDDVFSLFMESLKPSILTWSYFVNWNKVFDNTRDIEVGLNELNYLIGKNDFDDAFRFLIKNNPKLIKILPALVVRGGTRNVNFKILIDYKNKKFVYEDYDFLKQIIDDKDIEKYLNFVEKSGLKHLIQSQKIKNLVDYMIGIEAGIDSNGRKNRSGKAMEDIVDFFISDICVTRKLEYLKEANAKKIKDTWGIYIPVDKSSRRYDFVVNNGGKLFVFEANFYGGSGSKLKSTASEYRKLFDTSKGNFTFIWITDGFGWIKSKKPLREAFDYNDYIINLNMIESGIIDKIIT